MKLSSLNLRFRIFFSMVFLISFSFLLTGAITYYHFKKENEQYHSERLKRKEYAVSSAIDYFLKQEPNYRSIENLVALFDEKICELADIHELDINLYALEGHLLISSNPDLVESGRISEQLDTAIVRRLWYEAPNLVLETGNPQTGYYLSTFDFIRDPKGRPIAFMSLPYFNNDKVHLKELKAFLKYLVEIYFLLFAAAALLALLLSNYIASSLTEIAKRLKNTQLLGKNEPLYWDGDDEIGSLIKSYNRMLEELESSAVELARRERDMAWQEMARQVAHEIKNPLTPMRLQLQMLEMKLYTEKPERLKLLTASMIDQIDALSEIAEAFARFASMPELKCERFNLIDVVHKSVELFSEQGALYKTNELEIWVEADKAQWLRVMNNLIKNAVQAAAEGQRPVVKVEVLKLNNKARISIQDNGIGIEADKLSKIFEPKFTTKSGGMGLGLAIVKRIIEQSKGQIEVFSSLGEGTEFRIELPLANNS